jgi:hypothetical protein
MEPTTKWFCDTCGQQIQSVKDGWVEWIKCKDADGRYYGRWLRLVHHRPSSPLTKGCQYDESHEYKMDCGIVNDLSLESFVEADGLMQLLSLLSHGDAPQAEIIEMIQRIHIPGYEEARPYFQEAISEGEIEPNLPEGFYWQSSIARVIKKYCKS